MSRRGPKFWQPNWLQRSLSRRLLLRRSLQASGGVAALQALPSHTAFGQTAPRRFIQIFLLGGWDSALATDPVTGSKQTSGAYEPVYNSLTAQAPSGKSNLVTGPGLVPAHAAFNQMNTAFINGMFVEVTAHDLATRYMLTGTLSLTRGANYPSFIARAGRAHGGFPAHIVLGMPIPLGDTATDAPPLTAIGLEGLADVLAPPGRFWGLDQTTVNTAFDLVDTLNALKYGTTASQRSTTIQTWQEAELRLPELYAARFDQQLELDEATRTRYNVGEEGSTSQRGQLAAAFQVIRSGISPFVSVAFGDYDTHTNHQPVHQQRLADFSTGLSVLVNDLANTPDPAAPEQSLAATTTILVTSEFVRTPLFNLNSGTDHWQSASAIVMGAGVQDNVVIGQTNDQAEAMGWQSGPVTRNVETQLLPDHLAASILDHFGYSAEATEVSPGRVEGLFR